MIPTVCANCKSGQNVTNNDGQITLTLCNALPIMLGQAPNHSCAQFVMTDKPAIQVDDTPAPAQPEEGEDDGLV